jgi:hypothetical protein
MTLYGFFDPLWAANQIEAQQVITTRSANEEQLMASNKTDQQLEGSASSDNQVTLEDWLAARKETGLLIDPETAEVLWTYAQTLDPYGVDPELPEELQQIGREYFARSPGSDVWVWFGDLPDATRDALWARLEGFQAPHEINREVPF